MTPSLLLFLHAVSPLLFFTDLTRNPYATQITLLQTGLLLALILRVAESFRAGSWTVLRTHLDGPLLLLFAAVLAGWGASWAAHPALRPSIFHQGARALGFLAVNFLLPFFFAAQVRDPAWERRFQRTVLTVGAVAAAYGMLQYFGTEWIWSKALNPYNGRPVSTFGNPNFLSSYLVMLLPFALREFLRARWGARAGWGLLALLYGAALICTMTRSSWIGALVALAVLAAGEGPSLRKAWPSALLLSALALAMVFFWPGSPLAAGAQNPLHRAEDLFRGILGKGVYGSWHQRLLIWSCAADMLRMSPLSGVGWGCFELFYPFFQGGHMHAPVFQGFRTHANNAHNLVLEIASQAGWTGLGLAAWVALLALWSFRRRAPGLPEDRRGMAWAKAAALAGMLADNFFGNVSLFFAVPGFLFAWTAGSLASDVADGGEASVPFRRPGPLVAGALLTLAAAAGIVRYCRDWRAEVDYFDGYKKVRREDLTGAVRAMESSRAWRRYEVNNAYELGNAYQQQARLGLRQGLSDEPRALLQRAAGAYDDALHANAGYDEIHFNRASALLMLGRIEEAEVGLRTSLSINPLHEPGYVLLGDLLARSPAAGPGEAALFTQAVSYFPERKEFWNGLGHGLSRAGKHGAAAEAFARALALDFDYGEAEDNLRVAVERAGITPPPVLQAPFLAAEVRGLAKKSRWAEALSKAELLISLTPRCALSWLMAADLRAGTGDLPAALAAYNRFLEMEPAHRAGRLNKARILKQMGFPADARSIAEGLLREQPEDAEARAFLEAPPAP